jgi:hypothetical protein
MIFLADGKLVADQANSIATLDSGRQGGHA